MNSAEAYGYMANGWHAGRFAQAYILVGDVRETGRALAERVLQLVFCGKRDAPCGVCAVCSQVRAHTHPDVLWVEPEKRSRVISVDQIRATRSRILQTSFAGGWKACVIVAADRLGQEASNAFLKTLEEPPARSVFFLLTDSPQFLLSTIVSRCQKIILSEGERRLASAWEEELVAVLCDRRVGGAVGAFGGADRVAAILKALKAAAEESVQADAESDDDATNAEKETIDARANARFREQRTCLMRSLLFWQRDILLLVAGGDVRLLHFGEHVERLRERAGALTLAQAMENVRVVEEMNRQLEQNLPDNTVLGFGFTRLR